MDTRTLFAIIGTYSFAIIGVAVVMVIAWIRLFKKAGEGWWKVFIPVYGTYCQFKVADSGGIFFGIVATSVAQSLLVNLFAAGNGDSPGILIVSALAGIVILILTLIYCMRLAEAYGKSKGFGVGLFFLYPIFILVLAFGSSEYWSGSTSSYVSYRNWTCPDCGMVNAPSRGTCEQCGRVKPEGGALSRYQSATGTWKCPGCGAENPVSRGTCRECGTVRK